MENEEKRKTKTVEIVDDLVLTFVGKITQWEHVDSSAVQFQNALGRRFLKAHNNRDFIFGSPHIMWAATEYDQKVLKELFTNKLLYFTVHLADEDDLNAHLIKEKSLKNI